MGTFGTARRVNAPLETQRPSTLDEPWNRTLYLGQAGGIGEFRCPPGCRAWEVENRIGDMATVAFARDPVGIAQADGEPVVATPNEAMLYNAHQAYRRKSIDGHGDRCEFFVIRPHLLAEIVAAHDPRAAEDARRPLKWSAAPVASHIYMAQRVLYHHVRQGARAASGVDGLLVDECMINIVDTLVGAAAGRAPARARRVATGRDHRVWIEGAKDFLSRNYRRALTLEEVAAAVGLSVFHLCRLFKAYAGTTVHDYLRSLRARASLELLGERLTGGQTLAIGQIAAEMGFCNQSHFTRAFKHEFGATPTEVRRALREGIAERGLLGERGEERAAE